MTHAALPDGEFTFQDFCSAHPTARPLDLLKILTQHVNQGTLIKIRADAQGVTRTIYRRSDNPPPIAANPPAFGRGQETLRVPGA